MARKTYKVEYQEQGRGKKYRESFRSLVEARDYIRDRWQGVDYIDGPDGFHTDYCTYRLVGFELADIGKRTFRDDGEWVIALWEWLDLDHYEVEQEVDN